eukprot:6817128-Alexandrium_andersonii.AAC.1
MQTRSRTSVLELREPRNDLKSHPRRSHLGGGGSAPSCALNPMERTKPAGGHAGGAFRPGG